MADPQELPAGTASGKQAADNPSINNLTLESCEDDAFDEFYGEGSVPNMSIPIKSSAGIFDNFQEAGFTEELYLSDEQGRDKVDVEGGSADEDAVENISGGAEEEVFETEEEATVIWKSPEDLRKQPSQKEKPAEYLHEETDNIRFQEDEQLQKAQNETPQVHEHENTEESSGYYDGDTQPFDCSKPEAEEDAAKHVLCATKVLPVGDSYNPALAESASTNAALDSLVTFLDETSRKTKRKNINDVSKEVDESHKKLNTGGIMVNAVEDRTLESKLLSVDNKSQETGIVGEDEDIDGAVVEKKEENLMPRLTCAAEVVNDDANKEKEGGRNLQLSLSSSDGVLTLSATVTRNSGFSGDGHTPLYDAAVFKKSEAKDDDMAKIVRVEERKENEDGDDLTLTPSQILLTPTGKECVEGKDGILSNDEVTSPKAPILPPRNKMVFNESNPENANDNSQVNEKALDKTSPEDSSLRSTHAESLASLPFNGVETNLYEAGKYNDNIATEEYVALSKSSGKSQVKQAPWLNVVRETSKTVPTGTRVKKGPSSKEEEYAESIRGTKRMLEDSSDSSSEEEFPMSEDEEEGPPNKKKTVRWAADVNDPGKENDSQLSNSQQPKKMQTSSVLESLTCRRQLNTKRVDDSEELRDTSEESGGEADNSRQEEEDDGNEDDGSAAKEASSQGEDELRTYQAEARASAARQAAKNSKIAEDIKSLQRLVELEKRDREHQKIEVSLRQYIGRLKKELVSCRSMQSRRHSILEDIKKSHAAQVASLEKEQIKLQTTVFELQAEVLNMQRGQQASPETHYLCQKCLGVDDSQNDYLSVNDGAAASICALSSSSVRNFVTPSFATTDTSNSRSTHNIPAVRRKEQSAESARVSLDHEYREAESWHEESNGDSSIANDGKNKNNAEASVSFDCRKGSMKDNYVDVINAAHTPMIQAGSQKQELSKGLEDFESEEDDEEDTEVLEKGRIITMISQRRIANIINNASADFKFMRDIFSPIWEILKEQGGTECSKWKWVSGTIDLPNHVFGTPYGKGAKKGQTGVDFFVTELDLVSELLDEMERYHIKLQSRNVEKIKELYAVKCAKKRRSASRSTPPQLSIKLKQPPAKRASTAHESKKQRPKIKERRVIIPPSSSGDDTDNGGCEQLGSIVESDNKVLAAGQIMTRQSMKKCAVICSNFSSSGQLRRDLFIPIWEILQHQGGEDRSKNWSYVKISDPLLSNFGWAVPRCNSVNHGVRGTDYFVAEIDLVVAVCRNIHAADASLIKEDAWKRIMVMKSETEVSSNGTRRTRNRKLGSMESNVSGNNKSTASKKRRKEEKILNSKPKKTKRGMAPKVDVIMGDHSVAYSQNTFVGATALLNMSRINNDAENDCRATQSDDILLVKLHSVEKLRKIDCDKDSLQPRSHNKSMVSTSSLSTNESTKITEDASRRGNFPSSSASGANSDGLVITQEGITRLLNFRKNGSLVQSPTRAKEDSSKGELLILQDAHAVSPDNRFNDSKFHMTQESPEKGSVSFQSPSGRSRNIHDGLLKGITFLISSGLNENIQRKVRALGGSIAERIADIPSEMDDNQHTNNLILLSHHDKRRSIKYLFAASMGVPMVHFSWLTELQLREEKYQSGSSSVRPNPFDKDLFASTRLPLGLNLNSGRYRLQPVDVLETRYARQRVLANMTFVIVLANEKNEADWSRILEASGATIVKISSLSASTVTQKIDAVLIDSVLLPPLETAVPGKLNEAVECYGHDIPVIDLSWAVQCIVNMRTLRFYPRSKVDVAALQSSNTRQIFILKRKDDGVRFEVGDIVTVHQKGANSGPIFARIASFVPSSGRSRSSSHGVKVEVLEQHERCLVDGGGSSRLTCDISNIKGHVLLLKGKDFRQIESIYGRGKSVFVQKMKARRSK